MYGEKEKEIKAIEHKHMMMQEAAAIAAKADVGGDVAYTLQSVDGKTGGVYG